MDRAVWRRVWVVAGLVVAAFGFNTTENLPIGLLSRIAGDLHVSLGSVGYLVSGYGLTVAVVSLPIAQLTRNIPRRYVLSVLLAVLCAATWVSVLGSSFGVLLGARIVTAVCQALFWAVQGPVAVGLFAPAMRGRVMAVMSAGGAFATVLGVPAGTWLGQQYGWRVPFVVVGGLALVSLVVVGGLLPTAPPGESHGAFGIAPDRRRFLIVVASTALSVTGVFAGFTYIVAFLTGVGGFSGGSVSTLLGVFGGAGVAGVVLAGPHLRRRARRALLLLVGVQAVALLGLYAGARVQWVVVVMTALLGVSAAPVYTVTQSRVLHVAPGRTELALATNSAAFNVGVALGALVGAAVLGPFGVRSAFLLGGLFTLVALVVLGGEALVDTPLEGRREKILRRPSGGGVETTS